MPKVAAINNPHISALGWLLITVRLTLMLALLLACLPFYYLWRLLGLRRFWPRIFLAGVGMISRLDITIKGQPQRNALLLSNHVSWLDVPAITWATGSAFVGHDGLSSMPLLKHLCQMNDTVFVARYDRRSVAQQVAVVREAIEETGALTIFPEGTTSDGTGLLPFKSSLLSAVSPLPDGVVVQPVLLEYAEVTDIAWVDGEDGLDNFKRILARLRKLRVTVHFLPILEGEALNNRKAMAEAASAALLAQLAKR